jgi:hypothetical protein
MAWSTSAFGKDVMVLAGACDKFMKYGIAPAQTQRFSYRIRDRGLVRGACDNFRHELVMKHGIAPAQTERFSYRFSQWLS